MALMCLIGVTLVGLTGCERASRVSQQGGPPQGEYHNPEPQELVTSQAVYMPPRIIRLPPPETEFEFSGPATFEDFTPPSDLTEFPQAGEEEAESGPIGFPLVGPAQQHDPLLLPIGPAPRRAFTMEEYDDDAEAAAAASIDDLSAYFTAEGELSTHLRGDVQRAFTLARHGALHAARSRFVALLEEMARAKDAAHMTSEHSRALTAGLRALKEAEDFDKVSTDTKAIEVARVAGHQTPMLQSASARWTLPHEAMGMYHRYAERKLAAAVKGEQAGSMALFGIGRLYQQLAARQDSVLQPLPKGLTYFRAAVLAHPNNHLAANEAGVLLARAGRYTQSLPWFEHAVGLAPLSITHRNLAYVCEKLGDTPRAAVHAHESQRIASLEMSRGQLSAERGIMWVSPEEFNRRSGGAPPAAPQESTRIATAPPPVTQPAPPSPPSQQAVPPEPSPKPTPSFWW